MGHHQWYAIAARHQIATALRRPRPVRSRVRRRPSMEGRALDPAAATGADEVIARHQRRTGFAHEPLKPARYIHRVGQESVFESLRFDDVADQHLTEMHADAGTDRCFASLSPLSVPAPNLGNHIGGTGERRDGESFSQVELPAISVIGFRKFKSINRLEERERQEVAGNGYISFRLHESFIPGTVGDQSQVFIGNGGLRVPKRRTGIREPSKFERGDRHAVWQPCPL